LIGGCVRQSSFDELVEHVRKLDGVVQLHENYIDNTIVEKQYARLSEVCAALGGTTRWNLGRGEHWGVGWCEVGVKEYLYQEALAISEYNQESKENK